MRRWPRKKRLAPKLSFLSLIDEVCNIHSEGLHSYFIDFSGGLYRVFLFWQRWHGPDRNRNNRNGAVCGDRHRFELVFDTQVRANFSCYILDLFFSLFTDFYFAGTSHHLYGSAVYDLGIKRLSTNNHF